MSARVHSAGERKPAVRPAVRTWKARAGKWLEREGLIVVVVAMYAITSLVRLDRQLFSDSWLALLSGREIVQHGLPSHDTLNVWTHGRRWVDEQWLGQLALYGLSRLGGIRLALLTHVGLGVGAFAAAAALARKRGASPRAVSWVTVLAVMPCYLSTANMRTQSFAYPLFVILLWLLASDSREPSRRVFLVLPLLALWANLHGSAVLAAGLVTLHGVAGGVARARSASPRVWLPRTSALALLPWPCLFASPYAAELPHYYREILASPTFGQYVSEWRPTTLTPITAAFFVLAGVSLWSLGRARGRFTPFEKLTLLLLLVLSFLAIRNVVWFILATVILVPSGLTEALEERPSATTRRFNVVLGAFGVGGSALVLVLAAAHGEAWFARSYSATAADAVAAAAGDRGRVLANEGYADWLMWKHPALGGRIAWDARFELLTHAELENVGDFRGRVGNWRQITQGYTVLVLDATAEKKQARALLAQPGARLLFRDSHIVAIVRAT